MKCRNCGQYNDPDASFCEHCGANLNKSSMPTSTKMLIVVVIILVAGIGLVSGMMLMNNQAKPANNTTDNATADVSNSPSQSQNSSQYKTFSNSVISFQYPSSWSVLPNGANTMVIVGGTNYPHFSVYDESKYGYNSLQAYVASSIKGMKEDGFTVQSQRNMTVDGRPATELIYKGDSKILHMVLVERAKGTYYALEGSDNANNYGQSKSIFNQIINSFKFL